MDFSQHLQRDFYANNRFRKLRHDDQTTSRGNMQERSSDQNTANIHECNVIHHE